MRTDTQKPCVCPIQSIIWIPQHFYHCLSASVALPCLCTSICPLCKAPTMIPSVADLPKPCKHASFDLYPIVKNHCDHIVPYILNSTMAGTWGQNEADATPESNSICCNDDQRNHSKAGNRFRPLEAGTTETSHSFNQRWHNEFMPVQLASTDYALTEALDPNVLSWISINQSSSNKSPSNAPAPMWLLCNRKQLCHGQSTLCCRCGMVRHPYPNCLNMFYTERRCLFEPHMSIQLPHTPILQSGPSEALPRPVNNTRRPFVTAKIMNFQTPAPIPQLFLAQANAQSPQANTALTAISFDDISPKIAFIHKVQANQDC